MSLHLHNLRSRKAQKRKRIGTGNPPGHGTYSTRGQKGQRARSGGRAGLKYLGMKAMILNIPKKRGFSSDKAKYQSVNVSQLEVNFENGEKVTPELLLKKGIIDTIHPGVKILGNGRLSKKFNVRAHAFSKNAEKIIQDAGGTVIRMTLKSVAVKRVSAVRTNKKK